ncbi:ABC transporter permease [Nonomuraea sp. NPDC026600]|uniref:ABC transporter permease n=1 Tax=Nonomuraea sp. NPDC026600 TaxID=3155363 RepID=UPI0033DA4D38
MSLPANPRGLAAGLLTSLRGVAAGLLAPAAALVLAAGAACLILAATGASPLDAAEAMVTNALSGSSAAIILNSAAAYYISAVAVAFTFRLNLFNIGVEGQYRIAALCAAAVGAELRLPPIAGNAVVLLTAMAAGAIWAGIAAAIKGVNEVISTIALNFIAIGLISYLLVPGRLGADGGGGNNLGTAPLPPSLRDPGFTTVAHGATLYWTSLLALATGIAFYVLLERTVFGFDLRAIGRSPDAARFGGTSTARITVITMLLSGATAGLAGMPALLGDSGGFSLSFPSGLGFIGIAVALIGRNRAAGMAFGALLFSFLDNSSNVLQLLDISNEVVRIMEGLIVLAVVIAYELSARWRARRERQATPSLAAPPTAGEPAAARPARGKAAT